MKKKFNLDDLKVKSFVTDVGNEPLKTVKGGAYETAATGCRPCQTELCTEPICGTTIFNATTKLIIFW